MERPDIRIESRTASHISMVNNLYGGNPVTDFFVAARLPSLPVVPSLTSIIYANKDIISFPIAASAVVPIYNLPSLDRSVPLLLSRQVRQTPGTWTRGDRAMHVVNSRKELLVAHFVIIFCCCSSLRCIISDR